MMQRFSHLEHFVLYAIEVMKAKRSVCVDVCIYLFFRNVQVYTDINTKTNKIFYNLKHTFAIMFHYVETMLENYCLSFSTGLQAMLY